MINSNNLLYICVCTFLCSLLNIQNVLSSKDSTLTSISKDNTVIKDSITVVRKKAKVNRSELLQQNDAGDIRRKETRKDTKDLYSINEGTLVGMGIYRIRDTYLSREKYGGPGIRFLNERMRLLKFSNNKVSRQNIINIDVASTVNSARNSNLLSAFVDYSLGYHYRILPDPFFKILVGGNVRSMLGMVYSTRNGNNPATIHTDIDLNISVLAIYEFRIKKHPLAIRYQLETPFAGVLFSPVYHQSYYEIFDLGNSSNTVNFNSFHNKFALRNYLTLDFPLGGLTIRAGYLGTVYKTDINNTSRRITSNSFMLGIVKEFVAFGGREMRRRNLFHSAYY